MLYVFFRVIPRGITQKKTYNKGKLVNFMKAYRGMEV